MESGNSDKDDGQKSSTLQAAKSKFEGVINAAGSLVDRGTEQINAEIPQLQDKVTSLKNQFAGDQLQEKVTGLKSSLLEGTKDASKLVEGVIDSELINMCQEELLRFKVAMHDVVQKFQEGVAQVQTEGQQMALFNKLVEIVMSELGSDRMTYVWDILQQAMQSKEMLEMFQQVYENKDEFMQLMEIARTHRSTMQDLIQSYESGDWVKLQQIIGGLISQYDDKGYAKSAQLLFEAGQQVVNDGEIEEGADQAKGLASQGMSLINQLIMPSMSEFKSLAQYGEKKRLLREIKSATIEKLTNKILRSFTLEVAFITPFLLLVLLQYRQAALTDPTSECYAGIANWLLTYLLGLGVIALLRLLRVPVLRGLTHQFYFNYTLGIIVLHICFQVTYFVYGNSIYFKTFSPTTECVPYATDPTESEQLHFNPVMLQIVMGTVLLFHWFVFIGVIQLLLFVLILWSLWDGILHASKSMQNGFSASSLAQLFMEALGEGELQDSVMIGGIQYLMSDETYICKRCKEPFSQLLTQANQFEDQFEDHVMTEADRAADEGIVQLGCNPAHVFHAECIEDFAFCPECFVPIEREQGSPGTPAEGKRSANDDEDSQEEGLLLDEQDIASAGQTVVVNI